MRAVFVRYHTCRCRSAAHNRQLSSRKSADARAALVQTTWRRPARPRSSPKWVTPECRLRSSPFDGAQSSNHFFQRRPIGQAISRHRLRTMSWTASNVSTRVVATATMNFASPYSKVAGPPQPTHRDHQRHHRCSGIAACSPSTICSPPLVT